jgi:hypothetical protein
MGWGRFTANEHPTPTIARAVPTKSALTPGQLLAYEPFAREGKLAYVTLNIPAPCPPRSVVLVNQGRGFTSVFHLSTPGSLSVRDATASAMWISGLGGRGWVVNQTQPPPAVARISGARPRMARGTPRGVQSLTAKG